MLFYLERDPEFGGDSGMRIKLIFSLVLVIVSLGICASANSLPSKYVLLNHSGELTDYIGRYTEANSGKTFLVIEMELENRGYNTVDINPNYFAVVIDKVAYPYDKATYSTESPLDSVALLDGGKTSGYLVFQIPEDKTIYTLVFAGQEEEEVIYGDLVRSETQKEAEPEKPSRSVTYKLDGKAQKFTAEGEPISGYITQTIRQDIAKGSETGSFVEITIKTAVDESHKPLNEKDEMQKAIDSNIDEIEHLASSANYDEKPTYEATLANGDKVIVHLFKKVSNTYSGNYAFASYMLDSDTIVTVASTENKKVFDEILKTLEIGELQNSPS